MDEDPAAMECGECDHVEKDPIFLDTERCSKCGGMLTAAEEMEG